MTSQRISALLLGLTLVTPLAGQAPNVGLGIALSVPTGRFNSTTYAPTGSMQAPSNEGYDSAVGGQFTLSFPLEQQLAARLDVYGQSTNGQDTAPGYVSYNLEHDLLSFGGELQFFPGLGDAFRHRGGYLLAGLSMDLERFHSDYADNYWYGYTVDKTRLGGIVGLGYSFRPHRAWHSNVEVAYHKTLTDTAMGSQPSGGNPATPPADFLRFSYGFIF